MSLQVQPIKPELGARVTLDRSAIGDAAVTAELLDLIDKHTVLVFPRLNLTAAEQLALTDSLGERVNFSSRVAGGDAEEADVYTITLDPKQNTEPEYVRGTFFWHMDGLTSGILPPKMSILSAVKTAPKGGQTEFASTFAAYKALPEEEKLDYEDLQVMHTVLASVREVVDAGELDPDKRTMQNEHPLVWERKDKRKSLLVGYTADYVIGMGRTESRALLARLLEWTAQPAFTYRHSWEEGDLVVWDNTAALHRVIPYASDSGRSMRRTSIAGVEATN